MPIDNDDKGKNLYSIGTKVKVKKPQCFRQNFMTANPFSVFSQFSEEHIEKLINGENLAQIQSDKKKVQTLWL